MTMITVRMTRRTSLVVTVVLLCFVTVTSQRSPLHSPCPDPPCQCSLDTYGRMEVACLNGRLTSIPMARMSPSVEVIRIAAPPSAPNQLAIGGNFRVFKRLEELHIINSNVPNIGVNSFWGISSLRTLNLTGNNITLIVESNFKGLVNLEYLSIRDNAIDSFVSASFQNLPKLKILDLGKNRIGNLVNRLFYNLHYLESLDLSWNSLYDLSPDVFRDIWRLKTLKCRGCRLKTLNPLMYALLPDLQVLDLGDNNFKYLNREEFSSLNRLSHLYLDQNQISSVIDDTFKSLHLVHLTLGSNRIVRLDKNVFLNATLVTLDLSGNQFELLEKGTFASIRSNLTQLDLSRNTRLKLTSLSSLLGSLTLTDLNLAKNGYHSIPENFFGSELIKSLRHVNFSGNSLSHVPLSLFIGAVNLQSLDLSHNAFKGLDAELLHVIDRLPSFRTLHLQNNSWSCDLCHIQPLLRWIVRNDLFSSGCSEQNPPYCLRCANPPLFMHMPLHTLEESMLDYCPSPAQPIHFPNDPRFGLFVGCVLFTGILVSAAIAIIAHSRYHAAHYYTHEEDRPEIGTPPIPPPESMHLGTHSSDALDSSPFLYPKQSPDKMLANIDEVNMGFDSEMDSRGLDTCELTSGRIYTIPCNYNNYSTNTNNANNTCLSITTNNSYCSNNNR